MMKEKVLISGGSGMLGQRLSQMLIEKEYEVAHLSRSSDNKNDAIKTIVWDVEQQKLNADEISAYQHIIHLAGAGIIDEPWTEARKKVLLESRVKSALLLKNTIAKNTTKPRTFVSASAIGYYGFTTSDKIFEEKNAPADDLLSEICMKWEQAVDEVNTLGVSTAKIRIGMVLSDKGGALKAMAKPVKLGFGAALGSGKQWMPWIHIDDVCGIFIHTIENKLSGVFNAAAPSEYQNRNKTFTKILAKCLNKPLWLPAVPAFVLKMILGKRARLVLKGSRISSKKIRESGYSFMFKELKPALNEIYA